MIFMSTVYDPFWSLQSFGVLKVKFESDETFLK